MPVVSGLTVTLADRVRETTQTTGTGTYSLDGAPSGKRTFVAGIGNGLKCLYTVEAAPNWEVGIGTVTSGAPATLSRDTILASSNAGSAVSWGSGVKDIFVDTSAALANQIWARPSSLPIGFMEVRAAQVPSGSVAVIDFTSIASTAQLIYVNYTVIRSDTTRLFLQIGDSGGLETTGYSSAVGAVADTGGTAGSTSTTAFLLSESPVSGTTQYGLAVLSRLSTSTWHMYGNCSSISGSVSSGSSSSGAKILSPGPLDRVRLGASANFSAGGSVSCQIIHAVT